MKVTTAQLTLFEGGQEEWSEHRRLRLLEAADRALVRVCRKYSGAEPRLVEADARLTDGVAAFDRIAG